MDENFEESIELTPAVMTLEVLLEEGVDALSPPVARALKAGGYDEALSATENAYDSRGPTDREMALTYAVLLVGRERVDEAMEVLRDALEHRAQDVGLQLAQVEALLMKGDFEAAQSLLDGLESVSTLDPEHRQLVGDMYLDLDRDDRAMQSYQRAIDQGLDDSEIAYRAARMLSDRGRERDAAHYLTRAAEIAEHNPMLWEAAAEGNYEVERVEQAAHCWEQMLEHRPYDSEAWFMLGLSYWFLDDFAEAARAYEQVVDLNPRHRVAWAQLGDVWLTIGKGEKALEAFRQALQLEGDDPDVLNGAVLAAVETGDIEAALEWAERAVEVAPDDRESRYNYATVLLTLGRSDEARDVLEELVVEGEGRLDDYLGALAVAELKSGREDPAFEHIGEAIRLDGRVEWLASFAEELIKIRGVDEALEFIERADASTPDWQVVRPFLGYVCSGLAEDDEAADDYLRRFRDAVDEYGSALPVLWNFESWEAMAFRLERRFEKVFDAMLGTVEGRRDPERLDELSQ